jgi:hypothetical protein
MWSPPSDLAEFLAPDLSRAEKICLAHELRYSNPSWCDGKRALVLGNHNNESKTRRCTRDRGKKLLREPKADKIGLAHELEESSPSWCDNKRAVVIGKHDNENRTHMYTQNREGEGNRKFQASAGTSLAL